ncbi:MAG: hypothetical protein PWQ77_2231 [Kosmotogales bacterium]|nr:hypothetical protein [Kosmotogales bacterium]
MSKEYIYRDITLDDENDILNISRSIWDGDDYIPLVWKKFVEDNNNFFKGIEVDKKLIGFSNMVIFNEDSAWFEGLRVLNSERGKGYGKLVSRSMMKFALEKGIKNFYFSTYYQNIESIKLHEKMNFRMIKKYKYLRKNVSDKSNCAEIIYDDFFYPEKIMNNDWVFIIPEAEDKDRFFPNPGMIRDSFKNIILFSDDFKSNDTLAINYVKIGDENEFIKLLNRLKNIARSRNKGNLSVMCETEKETSLFKREGFEGFTDEKYDVFLYYVNERDLDLRN